MPSQQSRVLKALASLHSAYPQLGVVTYEDVIQRFQIYQRLWGGEGGKERGREERVRVRGREERVRVRGREGEGEGERGRGRERERERGRSEGEREMECG